jgi:hypothetical protein
MISTVSGAGAKRRRGKPRRSLRNIKTPGDVHMGRRTKRTNDPTVTLVNRNTYRGRRTVDLIRAYLHRLGNPTDTELQARVIAAAELVVLAEEVRGGALNSGRCKPNEIARLEFAASRAVARLGLEPKRDHHGHPPFKGKPKGPSLGDYLGEAAE